MARVSGSDPGGGGGGGAPLPLGGDLSGTTDAAVITTVGGVPIITDFASLEAAFPAVGGLHTITTPTRWSAPALISLPVGNRIVWTANSLIFGSQVTGVIGNYAGPLCSGPIGTHNGFASFNQHPAGIDWAIDGGGGQLSLDMLISLGANAGTIENVLSCVMKSCVITPQIPGGAGFAIGGAIGNLLIDQTIVDAPGVAPYTAWTVADTAVVTFEILVATTTFQSELAGDRMFDISTLATVPTSPAPTSTVGLFLQSPTLTGPGQMFAAGSVDEDDIKLVCIAPSNGPASRIIGDAFVDTDGAPSIILDNSGSPAGTKLVVPFDNSGNGGAAGTLRTLALVDSSRHSLVGGEIQYDGPMRSVSTNVSWTATINRSGGGTPTVSGWLQADDGLGGGWITIERTKATESNLGSTPVSINSGSVPIVMNPAATFRLVFDTDTIGTGTEFHSYEVRVQGRTAGG